MLFTNVKDPANLCTTTNFVINKALESYVSPQLFYNFVK